MIKEIKYIEFDTIDSTNIWCKQNYINFDNEYVYMVSSNLQTDGKGSKNRLWSSESGGLYTTICIPIDHVNNDINCITLVTALSIVNIFNDYGIDAKIKWPNDLILNGKKIGGILSEVIFNNSKGWIIIGIGINFNNNINNIERPIFPASSVKIETNKVINIKNFKLKLSSEVIKNFNLWIVNTFKYFLNNFEESNILKNKIVKIMINNKIIEGYYYNISKNGSLNLKINGSINNFYNGEIINLTKT